MNVVFNLTLSFISDRVAAPELWQLRVSGREVTEGRLHSHAGHALLLLLRQTAGDRGPL